MKGDFTRDSFDPAKHFSRVLSQQGRVTLDADANEQGAILLRTLRLMAKDLIGPHAAPREEGGFRITPGGEGGFSISAGRYYVDGILIENEAECGYAEQPDWPAPDDDALAAEIKAPSGLTFWLYLDVWERLVTSVEDPSIREVALGGPDTCVRAQVVWQVKGLKVDAQAIGGDYRAYGRTHACDEPLEGLPGLSDAGLAARLDPGEADDDPCVIPPDSRYRGAENQLYRVEIHTGGAAGVATFKWARDNGSRLAAWTGAGEDADTLAVSDSRGFEAGNWIEVSDDLADLRGAPADLVRLATVTPGTLGVDASSVADGISLTWTPQLSNPKVRRWDQVQKGQVQLVDGALPVREGAADAPLWIDLEDGVQVAFAPGGTYRSGDYWLVPARVATGGLLWPQTTGADGQAIPATRPPDGIEHHYAPLGFIGFGGGQTGGPRLESCRCVFDPGSDCLSHGSLAVGAAQLRNPPSRVVEQPVSRPVERPVTRPQPPARPRRTRTTPT